MIPFSPPRIDDEICNEVIAALRSGWITTGPRVKLFEKQLAEYCCVSHVLCINSATAGLEIMLRWFGIGPGDEVIVPAYTYCATANVVVHCGATPVFVDVNETDFNVNLKAIEKAITNKTKAIMPVDFGGYPCDYDEIKNIVDRNKSLFSPNSENQKKLGRIFILSDSAHSFGAKYSGKKIGSQCDASTFSFHAVKNLSTAEGGAVTLNLPQPFNNNEIYKGLCVSILHGQTKDALSKTQKGNWKYDVVEAGYKCNMTDLVAALGLVELKRYDADTLVKRKHIIDSYNSYFRNDTRLILPVFESEKKVSSYHLYPLRIKNISSDQRDQIMQEVFNLDVSVNAHFIPVPATSYYKSLGYDVNNYPVAMSNFLHEISLPVFYYLTDEQIKTVANAVITALDKVLK